MCSYHCGIDSVHHEPSLIKVAKIATLDDVFRLHVLKQPEPWINKLLVSNKIIIRSFIYSLNYPWRSQKSNDPCCSEVSDEYSVALFQVVHVLNTRVPGLRNLFIKAKYIFKKILSSKLARKCVLGS